MRKTSLLLIAVLVLAVAVPVFAGGGGGGGPADTRSFLWTTEETATTSTEWEDVPGLSGLGVSRSCSKHNTSVSAEVSFILDRGGAPVDVRVVGHAQPRPGDFWDKPLRPGTVSLGQGWPLAGEEVFSFTFVRSVVRLNGPNPFGLLGLSVQWRSPTGAEITLLKGTLTALWDGGVRLDFCGP